MMQNNCTLTSNKQKIRTYSFPEYMSLMEHYVKSDTTSGNDRSEEKIAITKLNFARMKRLNKTIVLGEKWAHFLQTIRTPQCWTVITEAWCGDGAQNIPALAKIAEKSQGKINFQLVFRDDNPEFMDQYLTNGGKAIPKLIARNDSGSDIFLWGPRPFGAAKLMRDWKANPEGLSKTDAEFKLHEWYTNNKQLDLLNELRLLILESDQL